MEGFIPLGERLGPKEAYSIIDEVFEILIHKVHDYEGPVNKMTGDGIMALFGAPIALEDAPQRAIRPAYAPHREMVRFNDRLKQKRGLLPITMWCRWLGEQIPKRTSLHFVNSQPSKRQTDFGPTFFLSGC